MSAERKRNLQFHILQALFWCGYCTLSTYATAWFLSIGLSSTAISLMTAVSMIVSFAGQLFWGGVCDKKSSNKRVFIGCFILTVGLTCVISESLLHRNRIGFFLYPVMAFFSSSLATNLDAWENHCFRNTNHSIGVSRGCAALAYSLFHFFYARAVANTEYRIIPFAAVFFCVLVVLFAMFTPSVKEEKNGFVLCEEQKNTTADFLGNRNYWGLLVIIFLVGLGTGPLSSMKVLLYEEVGKSVSFLGVDSLFTSGIQIPLFFLGEMFGKIHADRRLLWGGVILSVSSCVLVLASSPILMLLGNTAIAAAYPFILLSIRDIVREQMPAGLQTTANGICDAIYGSISGIAAMLYTGRVVDQYGIRMLVVISLLAYLLSTALIVGRYSRRKILRHS